MSAPSAWCTFGAAWVSPHSHFGWLAGRGKRHFLVIAHKTTEMKARPGRVPRGGEHVGEISVTIGGYPPLERILRDWPPGGGG
jgi:hypothetical protein